MLIAFSIISVFLAAYVAIILKKKATRAQKPWVHVWNALSALTLGAGVLAMHTLARFAFGWTQNFGQEFMRSAVFLLPGVFIFYCANMLAFRPNASLGSKISAGALVGFGAIEFQIAVLPYMPLDLWSNESAGTALGLGIILAIMSLWIAASQNRFLMRLIAALLMGIGLTAPHFAAEVVYTQMNSKIALSISSLQLAFEIIAVFFTSLFLAIIGSIRDQKEAASAREEIEVRRQGEKRALWLYRLTPAPLHAVDHNDRIVEVSERWLDLLGYNRHEVIGQPLTNFMTTGSALQRSQIGWPEKVKRGEVRDIEYQFLKKDGSIVDVLLSGRIEWKESEDGNSRKILGAVDVLVDVSDTKHTEEMLRHAQKMEAIGQLTGGIAHDFNNILASILGAAQIARAKVGTNDTSTKYLTIIAQSAEKGAALTQQLLAFSRRQSLKPEFIEPVKFLKEAILLFTQALERGISLESDFPAVLPMVEVDADNIKLAILNVVLNARDAMPDGGIIKIKAWLETLDEYKAVDFSRDKRLQGDFVVIEIKDTGIGIPEAIMSKVMDPFFTTKEVGKGSGLGLSQAYGVAHQSGGTLRINSKEGEGTMVRFYLPVQKHVFESDTQSVIGGGSRILLVEDDDLVAEVAKDVLIAEGYQVVRASNAQEALDRLHANPNFDLLFSDVMMPGDMDGLDLARVVRKENPTLPVLLATGFSAAAVKGIKEFPLMSKPYGIRDLLGQVENLLPRTAV